MDVKSSSGLVIEKSFLVIGLSLGLVSGLGVVAGILLHLRLFRRQSSSMSLIRPQLTRAQTVSRLLNSTLQGI
jgi:hypothetical protein